MKIVIDSAIPYIEGLFEPYSEVHYVAGVAISADIVHDADVLIIRTRTRCDATLLANSKVKLVATATIGTDHIDFDWCQKNGIEVVSAAGCNAAAVLQWVAAVLVELVGDNNPNDYTLGIVGVGNVGSLVAKYAKMWGFKVLCNDVRTIANNTSIEEIAKRADIITFHVPLNSSTRGIIDDRFAQCGATIINSSRGEIANETALLANNTQYCADVWCSEPNINRNLLKNSLIATPHIAGYSAQGKANATTIVANYVCDRLNIEDLRLRIKDWYPPEVQAVRRIGISWQELKDSIKNHINLRELTNKLKSHPEHFETMRNNYALRQEYF